MIILHTTNTRKGLSVSKEYGSAQEAIDLAREYAEDEDVHVEVYSLNDVRRPWLAVTLFEANAPTNE